MASRPADTALMSAFSLPVVLRTATADIDLVVDLPGPTSFAAVLPDLLACAGLPADTRLHAGAGQVEDSLLLGSSPLLAGCVLATYPDNAVAEVGAVALSCVAGPDAGGSVALSTDGVTVGRDPGCDLSAADPELSRQHARVRPSTGGAQVVDLQSANGIHIDGVPVDASPGNHTGSGEVVPGGSRRGRARRRRARRRARHRMDGPVVPGTSPAPFGALLRFGGSLFRIELVPEQRLLLTPDDRGRLAVSRPARVLPGFTAPLGNPAGPVPVRTRRPIPVLSAVIGAVAGAAIALLTGLWMFLLLAALGPVMLVAGAVSDRISGRRSHRRVTAEYRQAAERYRRELDAAVAADRVDAWDRYPDPATLARRVSFGGTRLWERRRADPDFLRLTLGVGERPARLPLPQPPPVSEAPITVDLGAVGVLGLAGSDRSLLRWLLAQLVSLHSPADLRLSVFSGNADLSRIPDLPHAVGDGYPGLITSVDRAGAEISRLLALDGPAHSAHPAHPARSSGGGWPVTVVVLDDAHRWRRLPGMGELLASARAVSSGAGSSGIGGQGADGTVVAICLSPRAEGLPMECAAVVTADSGWLHIADENDTAGCEPTGVSASYLDQMTRALTPLFDRDAAGGGLPGRVLLSDLMTGDVSARLAQAWQLPTVTAVLGVGTAGPLRIDLERDGPHMLIAGTTGSGKSELLQTLVTGLALAAGPDHTSFLLLDYKGGAAFGRLVDLPHTTAVVTDLDPATAVRALTGLRAEVRRREQLLAGAGVADLATLRLADRPGPTPTRPAGSGRHADQQSAAPGSPSSLVVPPSLVIVVDEYATLGAELPEFLSGLLDIAQRGRSLGLHLVLATQRPAGVLSPALKANIAVRICLRVEDDADSVDVLDTADAARLGAAHPGRALLRRERGRLTLFQVATVSLPAQRGHRVRRRHRDPAVGGLPSDALASDVLASDVLALDDPAGGGRVGGGLALGSPDVDIVVAAARAAAAGRRPPPPWLPALPARYCPSDDQVLGLLDEPAQQRQRQWRATARSTLVVGGPGSGRSMFLRRLGWSAAATGDDLLVVDTGGQLADLAAWPAVRSHLDGRDPVLVQRLIRRLADDLRERANRPGPPVTVLLDDWDILGRELDALDFGISTVALAEAAAHGPPLGVRVAVAGDLRLQHHRMSSGFGGVLRLGVDARGELAPLPAGRGWWQDTEVQCALTPAEVARPAVLPHPRPRSSIVVRPLPVEVTTSELPPARPQAVPIGIGGDEAEPALLDLTGPGGGVLVAGPRRSGVSGALRVLGLGAAAGGIRVLRALARPSPPLVGVRDVDMRRGTAELIELLVDHHGPLLLVVDEVDCWLDADTGVLERFLSAAGPGQQLALGCRLDRALRSQRGPVAELAALRTGILLAADASDGGLLGTIVPRRRGPSPPGRGHLVIDGAAQVVQVAQVSPVAPVAR